MKRRQTKHKQQGFGAMEVLIVIVVLSAIVILGWVMFHRSSPAKQQTATNKVTHPAPNPTPAASANITWMQTADGYTASGTPPYCPAKIVQQFPVDLTQVTAVLYPGQFRGGNYKPHGGLRFDKATSNAVTVKAPFDGKIIDGAAYLADNDAGDVQYTFDVMNDCGMMYRVGHLLTLPPQLADLAKTFPAPVRGDSRTTRVDAVPIKTGTVLATAIGTSSDHNVFFDWGVYDWRTLNAISANASWLTEPQHNNSLAKHAICWFDQLPSANQVATVRGLPAGDPASGKTSDYCK